MDEKIRLLEIAVRFYRNYKNKLKTQNGFSAIFSIETNEWSMIEHGEAEVFYQGYDKTCQELEVSFPSHEDAQFAFIFDDFLAKKSHLTQIPQAFYIAELDYFFPFDKKEEGLIAKYKEIIYLVSCLEKLSDYEYTYKTGNKIIIFFQGKPIDILVKYTSKDAESYQSDGRLVDICSIDDVHKDQIRIIAKINIIKILENVTSDERFSMLLRQSNELAKNISENYQLYINNFSFEKIKDDIERDKLEFIIKLNKIISDMQNQLLAIPIAFLLSGAQIDQSAGNTPKNAFIFTGICIFFILMYILIRNQLSSAIAVEKEILNQKKKIEESNISIKDRIDKSYEALIDRVKSIKRREHPKNCVNLRKGAK